MLEPAARRREDAWLLVALFAALSLPLIVALVVLHDPRWFPILDMAEIEMRVRDVTSSHPPLIGLAGRIGPFGPDGGSHPGPISFYLLWPFWALFGGSAYGMLVGQVALDIAAIGLSLWMAYRRRGLGLAFAVAVVLAILMRAYGAFLLTLPWNPYMPVLWWFVFLLAVWSILDDDLPMLVVAVIAGSIAMQTHIPYLGLVGGFAVFVAAWIGVSWYRRRREQDYVRAAKRWGLIALVLGIVLWTPPVIDNFVHEPGNIDTIREHFASPPEDPIGFGTGIEVFFTQIDPVKLFTRTLVRDDKPFPVSGSKVPGALLLLAWAGSVVVVRKLQHRLLQHLDIVIGVAVVLGIISAARIFGDIFFYLLLWAWGIAALMVLAIGWTVAAYVRTRLEHDATVARARRAGLAGLGAVMAVMVIALTINASEVTVQSPRINANLEALVPPTAAALEELEAAGTTGPYLVTWLPDPQAIGSEGYGLLNELLREGFDARAASVFRPGATRFHIIDPAVAGIEVHLATGLRDIERWRCMVPGNTCTPGQRPPGIVTDRSEFREVAFDDPRSEEERAEFERLRLEVIDDLRRAGLDERVAQVDDNLFMLGLSAEVPVTTRNKISDMLALGMPAAVFIGPSSGRP